MKVVWEIKLQQMAKGWRVLIRGDGRSVQGRGDTPYRAYRDAENQLIFKPAFFINPEDER